MLDPLSIFLAAACIASHMTEVVGVSQRLAALPRVEHAVWSQDPEQLERPVRMFVQVHSLVEEWEPALSRYAPSRYVQLVAWADEQLLWQRAEWDAPGVLLFVPRGGSLERRVRAAEKHDRLQVLVEARERLRGRLLADVTALGTSEQHLPEGSILHALRAERLVRDGGRELAVLELERALAAPLHDAPRRALEARVRALRAWLDRGAAGVTARPR